MELWEVDFMTCLNWWRTEGQVPDCKAVFFLHAFLNHVFRSMCFVSSFGLPFFEQQAIEACTQRQLSNCLCKRSSIFYRVSFLFARVLVCQTGQHWPWTTSSECSPTTALTSETQSSNLAGIAHLGRPLQAPILPKTVQGFFLRRRATKRQTSLDSE